MKIIPIEQSEVRDPIAILPDLPIRVAMRPGLKKGILHMTYSDCGFEINDKEGNSVGSMYASFGGTIQINLKDGVTLYIDKNDLWKSICKAMNREDLIPNSIK